MIQESYVSFEQAKALKELGFPQKIGVLGDQFKDDPTVYYVDGEYYNKATLSLVQKWLREEKKYIIELYYTPDYNAFQPIIWKNSECVNEGDFNTYEQALSAGIDKCIELLKEKKC